MMIRSSAGIVLALSVAFGAAAQELPRSQFKVIFKQVGLLQSKQLEGVFAKVRSGEDEIMFPYTYTEPEAKPARAATGQGSGRRAGS